MTTFIRIGVVIVALGLAAGACRDPFTPSKEHVLREVARTIPQELCKKGTIYLECWSFNWDDCMTTAYEVVNDVRVSIQNDPAEDRVVAGPELRQSMLEMTRNIFMVRRVGFMQGRGPRCDDRSAWPE